MPALRCEQIWLCEGFLWLPVPACAPLGGERSPGWLSSGDLPERCSCPPRNNSVGFACARRRAGSSGGASTFRGLSQLASSFWASPEPPGVVSLLGAGTSQGVPNPWLWDGAAAFPRVAACPGWLSSTVLVALRMWELSPVREDEGTRGWRGGGWLRAVPRGCALQVHGRRLSPPGENGARAAGGRAGEGWEGAKGNGEDRFPQSAVPSLLSPWHRSGLSPVASPGGLASAVVVLGGSVGGLCVVLGVTKRPERQLRGRGAV